MFTGLRTREYLGKIDANDRIQRFTCALVGTQRWLMIRVNIFGAFLLLFVALWAALSRGELSSALVGLLMTQTVSISGGLSQLVPPFISTTYLWRPCFCMYVDPASKHIHQNGIYIHVCSNGRGFIIRVRFHIIRNSETMHDWHLPTFYVRELRIIWKRTRTSRYGCPLSSRRP